MKKFLLSLVALMATMGAFAQDGGWNKSFLPVAEDNTPTPVVAQAGDGSVYVAVQRGIDFNFAGKLVAGPEIVGSGVIVKYDKTGAEQWAVTLDGAASVTAVTADADGTLYAAGVYSDEVIVTAADGSTAKLSGEVSAFILKLSADGKVVAQKTLAATADADLLETGMYWPDNIYVTPNIIKVNGEKVYVAASFNANVEELGWKAAYLNVFDFMYMENRSKGIFSLAKSDLSGAANVLTVQSTERISYSQCYPEALNFDFDDKGNVCYAFIGFGNLTLATADAGSKDFAFETTDDESGMKEHALVGGVINGTELKAQIRHAEKNSGEAVPYSITNMYVVDGVVYVGGTAYGNYWFDSSVTHDFTYAYMAAIDIENQTPQWAIATPSESQAIVMVLTGEEVHAATDQGNYTIKSATGEMTKDENGAAISDAAAWGNAYAVLVTVNKNEVMVLSQSMNGGEEELDPNLVEIPQSQGFEYDDFARAELVEGEKYNTYTVTNDLQIAIKMMDVDVEGCDYVVIKFAEPVAAGWKLAFWSNQDLTDVPEGAKEYKYVFADDPKCGVTDGILPQICMMTFFGGYTAPLEAKVVGIYKHKIGGEDAIANIKTLDKKTDGKFFENGRIVIRKGGVKYNVAGQPIK